MSESRCVYLCGLAAFPFSTSDAATQVRVLLGAMGAQSSEVTGLVSVLDESMVFQTRYSSAEEEVHRLKNLLHSWSPAGAERARAMVRGRVDRRGHEQDDAPILMPRRGNMFAPGEPAERTPGAEGGAAMDVLVRSLVEAEGRLRELRASVDDATILRWRRALHDAASLAIAAGRAYV